MKQKKQVDSTQQSQVNFDFNPEEINELSTQVTEMQFLGGASKENVEQEEVLDTEEFADFMGEDIPSAVNEEDFSFEMDGLPTQEDNSEGEFNFGEENELNEDPTQMPELEEETEELESVEEEGSQKGEIVEEEVSKEEAPEETENDNQEEVENDNQEEVENDNQEEVEVSEQETAEETKPKMKIKEVKYGMTVITNIGNYENIRTHIEATAEVDNNEDFIGCIQELSNQIRRIGRHEYAEIKRKNMRQPNQLSQQNRPQQGEQNYQNRNQQQSRQGVNPNQQGQTRQPYGPQQNQNNNPTSQNHPNEQRPQ